MLSEAPGGQGGLKASLLESYFTHAPFIHAASAISGRRNIVLCGVDLTRAECFCQDPLLYPETAQFEYMSRTGKHMILTRYAWGTMPIDQVVGELKQQVFDPAGIELYVEDRSSALWPPISEVPSALLESGGAGNVTP